MKRVHSLNVLALGILFIMPMLVSAQTNVLHRVFEFSSAQYPMNDDDDFDYENCYGINSSSGDCLQIGKSSGTTGSIETKAPLDLNGNAILMLKVRVYSGTAKYKVSTIGGGTIDNNEYTINDTEFRYDAILIRDGNASTRIKVEGTEGCFDLGEIEVVSIGDGYFHESFSRMASGSNADFEFNKDDERYASVDKCDNIVGASFSSLIQSEGCIYFIDNSSSSYVTPPFGVNSGNMALLSFSLARGTNMHSFSVATEGESKLSPLNSLDIGNLSSIINVTPDNRPEVKQWSDYFAVVTNMNKTTRLVFSGYGYYLGDVKLTPYAILDDQSDNSTVIFNNRGNCWVTLTRTLGAGYWNTLCLPFDITQNELAEVAGEGANPEIQRLASASDGVFRFEPVAADATIEAGTPFIVKVSKKVVNPQFRNVVLKDVAAKAIEKGNYQFVGTYSPVNLNTDKTHYFLGKNGKLKYPGATANKMNGLRAYFVTPTSGESSRVSINGEEMDAIELVDIDRQNDVPVYDLRGVRHNTEMLGKGVYIRDGRKIVIK